MTSEKIKNVNQEKCLLNILIVWKTLSFTKTWKLNERDFHCVVKRFSRGVLCVSLLEAHSQKLSELSYPLTDKEF